MAEPFSTPHTVGHGLSANQVEAMRQEWTRSFETQIRMYPALCTPDQIAERRLAHAQKFEIEYGAAPAPTKAE